MNEGKRQAELQTHTSSRFAILGSQSGTTTTVKPGIYDQAHYYFAAALDVESHSSFRGTKPSFCFPYALEAPRSRIA